MTKKSIVSLSAVLAIVFATSVNACDKKCGKKDGKTVAATVATKTPGSSKSATTVATTSKPCCGKSAKTATTVATKTPGYGKSATSATTVATTSKPCCAKSGKSATTASAKNSGCRKSRAAAVLASMPTMSYHAGDYSGSCQYSAKAKAKETNSTLTFVVDGKDYESRGEANVALASLLTDRANEMAELKFTVGDQSFICPHAAQGVADKSNAKMTYQLAGFEFSDRDQANKLAETLRETISTSAVIVKADGKSVSCAKSARAAGKTVTYVVGDEETSCEVEAKLLLAQRLVRTIVETAAGAL